MEQQVKSKQRVADHGEVFTAEREVKAMCDLVADECLRIDSRFLDPACKSGVFLREIAKRLITGLEPQFPDLQDRLDHIFHKQLYGIAITDLTAMLSRRSVYCSKYPASEFSVSQFDDTKAYGNIRYKRIKHTWGKTTYDEKGNPHANCIFCGASKEQYDRSDDLETHAYEWIHTLKPEEILNMKFDVIISNPPYQLSDGGSGPSAMPLYNQFVSQAKKLSPHFITMIIPARWYAGGKGLDTFRNDMLSDKHLSALVDYETSKDCFSGVDIAGGICYFLWDRENDSLCKVSNVINDKISSEIRSLDEYPVFIRSNESVHILRKVLQFETHFLDEIVLSQKPFGFRTYARGDETPFEGAIKLLTSKGWGYVKRADVEKNADGIDKYKVICGRLVPSNGELDVKPGEGYRVMTNPQILLPGEINTETYITLGIFNTETEAINYQSYLRGKLSRFLLRQAVSSVNINREVFKFVPLLDFKEEWTDEKLYKKYGLTDDEILFVEGMIRNFDGGEE